MAKPGLINRSTIGLLKVFYLAAVTAATFSIPSFEPTSRVPDYLISALLVGQILALLAFKISLCEIILPAWRLKWLFVFLIIAYAFLPPETPTLIPTDHLSMQIPGVHWTISVDLSGVAQALRMCMQIVTVLLSTSVVRLAGERTDLREGLERLRFPSLFAHSLDHTLDLLGGTLRRPGRGGGGGDRQGRVRRPSGHVARGNLLRYFRPFLKGDFSVFAEAIRASLRRAAEGPGPDVQHQLNPQLARDVAVVSGVALCMSSIKILKLLPGLPFASGHKTVFLFPLYVLASRLTYSRWGATTAGSLMGVIGFLQGDGRFGILEIFKHIAPGIIIDLTEPVVRRWPSWALGYCFIGMLAGIARTATELIVIFALGARSEIYLLLTVRLIPNLLSGFLSGFVTLFVIRAFINPNTLDPK